MVEVDDDDGGGYHGEGKCCWLCWWLWWKKKVALTVVEAMVEAKSDNGDEGHTGGREC